MNKSHGSRGHRPSSSSASSTALTLQCQTTKTIKLINRSLYELLCWFFQSAIFTLASVDVEMLKLAFKPAFILNAFTYIYVHMHTCARTHRRIHLCRYTLLISRNKRPVQPSKTLIIWGNLAVVFCFPHCYCVDTGF